MASFLVKNGLKYNGLIHSISPNVQFKQGKQGKWYKSNSFFSNNGGSSNGNKGPGNGNFKDGFDGSKPVRSTSELFFFSTGKSFASYPLNHPIVPQKNSPAAALENIMIPSEVKYINYNNY